MFESLFKYPTVLARHRNAPFFEERYRYLRHRAQQGCAHAILLHIARELLLAVKLIKMPAESLVTTQQIRTIAERWARQQYRRGRAHSLRWPRDLFVQIVTDWLRFIGRLAQPVAKPNPFKEILEEFRRWMDSERGLSSVTIRNYCWHLNQFLQWCEEYKRDLISIQISDVDTFLSLRGNQGWSCVSIVNAVRALKAYFRYAGQRGWCDPNIAAAVQGPRLFSQSTLPSGPSWEEVENLIRHVDSERPRDIRDRAIILLFALYGLRSGEVARLRLENIDWENNRLSVYRSKQRKPQTYPLVSTVGQAIIRYLRTARQKTSHREIFLTLKAPFCPLSIHGLYHIVNRAIINAEIKTRKKGPHALRHACAMHLVSKGLSLKEIGDHLGHRSTSATRIYAKVNLPQLRLVADVDLGGLS